MTSQDKTVCYAPEDHDDSCPINEIRFVLNDELASVEGNYSQATFNSQYTLLYSKTNLDALPITATSVTKFPCLDPTRSADHIELSSLERKKGVPEVKGEFYPLELDRFNFSFDEAKTVKKKCYQDESDKRYT